MILSSSKFAAAAGLSPYMSRQQLWRILTGREQPQPMNQAMQWGVDNEHRAVAAVEAELGVLFEYAGGRQLKITKLFQNPNEQTTSGYNYSTTPDGISSIGYGLEVKCPTNMYDCVPEHYMPQVQGQIEIADLASVYFACWTPEETRIWRVPRHDDYIGVLFKHLDVFMDCVHNDTEPKRARKPTMPDVPTERIL